MSGPVEISKFKTPRVALELSLTTLRVGMYSSCDFLLSSEVMSGSGTAEELTENKRAALEALNSKDSD